MSNSGYFIKKNRALKSKRSDKIFGNDIRELLDRGISHMKENGGINAYVRAIDCFSKILDIEPNNDAAVSRISEILMGERRHGHVSLFSKIAEFMEKVVVSNPNNADAWNALGWAYQTMKDPKMDKCKQCYDNAKEIESNGKPLKNLKEFEDEDETVL